MGAHGCRLRRNACPGHLPARLFGLSLMISVVLGVGTPLQAASHKWALLVGTESYQRADIDPVSFAVRDVRAVAEALKRQCGFPGDNVLVLASDSPAAERATSANIIQKLRWLAAKLEPQDVFWFYFCGQWTLIKGKGEYLLTWESNPATPATLSATSLPRKTLDELLGKMRGAASVICLDACDWSPSVTSPDGIPEQTIMQEPLTVESPGGVRGKRKASAVISCCRLQELGWLSGAKLNLSFFAWSLMEGLKGDAADAQGQVSVAGLVRYIQQKAGQGDRKELELRTALDGNIGSLVLVPPQLTKLSRLQSERRLTQEDDIQEAVFRHQFGQYSTGLFFLSPAHLHQSPSEFIRRFRGMTPAVKHVSECKRLQGFRGGGADKKTGEGGIILRIDRIVWVSDDEALVEGGYYAGSLAASGNVFRVIRQQGKWVVKEDKMMWIS